MSAGPTDVPLTRETLREQAASGERFGYLYSGVTVRAPIGAGAANSNPQDDASFVVCGRH